MARLDQDRCIITDTKDRVWPQFHTPRRTTTAIFQIYISNLSLCFSFIFVMVL